jgi:type I restriction enzyme M protein
MAECNLHSVLDLPAKVFQAGVKTVVLFFKKGEPTKNVWFYQLNLDRTLGKTNPLNEDDLREFVELQKTKADSANSWSVDVSTLDENFDLSVKNPNKVEIVDERTPQQIAEEIKALNDDSQRLLDEIMKML